MFKIETHLHTTYMSQCGWLGAVPILKAYQKAGYSAIVVTDHFNRTTFDYAEIDVHNHTDIVEHFQESFRRLEHLAADYNLKVYAGAELRFDENDNDYLLYGYPDSLLKNADEVVSMGIEAFAPLYRQAGAVLFQAHPYRPGCTPADASLLDGIEVKNTSPRHNSHDHLALAYAKEHNLRMSAGSDAHRTEDLAQSGIYCDELPADSFAFAELMRSGNYTLI